MGQDVCSREKAVGQSLAHLGCWILRTPGAAAGRGVEAGIRALKREGDLKMEQGPSWGFLGLGLCPRL